MFFRGSRYLGVGEYEVAAPGGEGTVRVVRTRSPSSTERGFLYQVVEGDRIDLLSNRFYRTPRKWWLICDANPGLMSADELLEPGRKIWIPRDRVG